MEQCLENFGGGICHIDIYSGYKITIPPCASIDNMNVSDVVIDNTQPSLHLGYTIQEDDDGELDHQTPASAKIAQQLAQQGVIGTLTATMLVSGDIDTVCAKVQQLQTKDMIVVFTLMNGSTSLVYLLPGTTLLTAEPVIDDDAKVTVTLTGKTMNLFIKLL